MSKCDKCKRPFSESTRSPGYNIVLSNDGLETWCFDCHYELYGVDVAACADCGASFHKSEMVKTSAGGPACKSCEGVEPEDLLSALNSFMTKGFSPSAFTQLGALVERGLGNQINLQQGGDRRERIATMFAPLFIEDRKFTAHQIDRIDRMKIACRWADALIEVLDKK